MPGYAYRVTPNQMYAVNLINKELGMDFHPTNKFMASEYIGKHYDKAKAHKAMREHGTTEIKCPHQHNCAYISILFYIKQIGYDTRYQETKTGYHVRVLKPNWFSHDLLQEDKKL